MHVDTEEKSDCCRAHNVIFSYFNQRHLLSFDAFLFFFCFFTENVEPQHQLSKSVDAKSWHQMSDQINNLVDVVIRND